MEEFKVEKESPQEVWKYFKEISKIPRQSGKEEKIRDYLIDFARKRNLEYMTDEYFNVVIRKKASEGYENEDYLAFQAHTDMICEKEKESTHDFSKDAIELIKDGDWIKAKKTTLGADNGIGVAFMLAILDAKEMPSPKIECIFTVQEETTMIGAKQIDINQIRSKRMISLDHGKEGEMVISSANCMEWFGKIKKEWTEVENLASYELAYSNFKGGHSGGNIADEKRGNPIKLGIEILSELDDVYLSYVQGGSRVNVIPRDFKVRFSCSKNAKKNILKKIQKQKEFYGKDVKIELKQIENVKKVFSKETTNRIIGFIQNYPNGALKMDEKENVILSANFGAIRDFEEDIRLEYSLRSNDRKLRNRYLKNLKQQVKGNHVEITWEQELKGFEPDDTSQLVTKVSEIYQNLFQKPIEKKIVQGVVEGGIFKDRIEGLEYICIGADTLDVHSPKERVSIKSVQRTWEYLREIIKSKK